MFQWVGCIGGLPTATLIDVHSHIYGIAHRTLIGHTLARNVVAHTVVGRSAHHREVGGYVHPIGSEHLEWSKALVVVHSQHRIILAVATHSKEAIGRKGTKSQHTRLVGLHNGGFDNLLLLGAEQAAIACVGVECQHRNPRLTHPKVLLERLLKLANAFHNELLGERSRHLRHGQVYGCKAHLHHIAAHQHQPLALKLTGQELGVSGGGKALAIDAVFVDGSGNEHIYCTLLHIGHSPTQRLHSHSTALGSCLPCGDAHIAGATLHKVEFLTLGLGCRAHNVETYLLATLHRGFVEGERFGGAIEHIGGHIEHTAVPKNLHNRFGTNAIGVAKCYAYFYVVLFHLSILNCQF